MNRGRSSFLKMYNLKSLTVFQTRCLTKHGFSSGPLLTKKLLIGYELKIQTLVVKFLS